MNPLKRWLFKLKRKPNHTVCIISDLFNNDLYLLETRRKADSGGFSIVDRQTNTSTFPSVYMFII